MSNPFYKKWEISDISPYMEYGFEWDVRCCYMGSISLFDGIVVVATDDCQWGRGENDIDAPFLFNVRLLPATAETVAAHIIEMTTQWKGGSMGWLLCYQDGEWHREEEAYQRIESVILRWLNS